MDETHVEVGGKDRYLYRSVDKQGNMVDSLPSQEVTQEIYRYLETRNTEFLFEQVSNRMEQIKQYLKQLNPRVITFEYLRASVIVD